jgi:hypothetical protein
MQCMQTSVHNGSSTMPCKVGQKAATAITHAALHTTLHSVVLLSPRACSLPTCQPGSWKAERAHQLAPSRTHTMGCQTSRLGHCLGHGQVALRIVYCSLPDPHLDLCACTHL